MWGKKTLLLTPSITPKPYTPPSKTIIKGLGWGKRRKRGVNWQKNLLDDLPGVKRRKKWVNMTKKHTRGAKNQ